ncbi:hypothetical protein EJB05_23354, partial [Eragrostis curvula]
MRPDKGCCGTLATATSVFHPRRRGCPDDAGAGEEKGRWRRTRGRNGIPPALRARLLRRRAKGRADDELHLERSETV